MAYDEGMMQKAIDLAREAASRDEVPIGAVLVKNGRMIACAANEKEQRSDACAHAEMLVLQRAAEVIGNWYLEDCELYCTLEPCPMCAGAMINSRISKLYFGAFDQRFGCAGSRINLLDGEMFNHTVEVYGGCMAEICSQLLSDFFKKKRK